MREFKPRKDIEAEAETTRVTPEGAAAESAKTPESAKNPDSEAAVALKEHTDPAEGEEKPAEAAAAPEGKTPAPPAPAETASDSGKPGTEITADSTPDDSVEILSPAYVPGKKKFKKRWIVLAVLAVLLIGFFVFRSRQAATQLPQVEVAEVTTGDIEEIVTISGNVTSAEKKNYYSTVSAAVTELNIKAGDRIRKGEFLYAYSKDDLDLMKQQAQLALRQAQGSYNSSVTKNAKATDVLRGNSIHDINNRLTEITAEIDALNYKITEKTDRLSGTVTELQNTLLDIDQNGILDSQQGNYALLTGSDVGTEYITRREDSDNDASSGNRQMALALQQAINEKQYALQHDAEIEKWQREITALNEEKATLTEQKTVEQSRLTGGDFEQLKAAKELSELQNGDTIADIEAVENGVFADFAGVVTAVNVAEGATAAKGSLMFSVESTDSAEITLQISKADMSKVRVGQQVDITINGHSYAGEVTRISGVATKNATGVPVVDAAIRIKDPDDQIILGVEASNKIHTDHAEDVIVIPYDYVGADKDGDFVLVVEDGIAKRRAVTLGLTTTTEAEIREGLRAGEQVVTGDVESIVDGTPVQAVPVTAE